MFRTKKGQRTPSNEENEEIEEIEENEDIEDIEDIEELEELIPSTASTASSTGLTVSKTNMMTSPIKPNNLWSHPTNTNIYKIIKKEERKKGQDEKEKKDEKDEKTKGTEKTTTTKSIKKPQQDVTRTTKIAPLRDVVVSCIVEPLRLQINLIEDTI